MNRKLSYAALAPACIENQISCRSLYFELLNDSAKNSRHAHTFLLQQLEHASRLECDLPPNIDDFTAWAERNVFETGLAYSEYRKARKNGAARRYFPTKSHALLFLKAVAPTKLVDGAWLYGLLSYWQDARFSGLIRTYLEELGDGLAEKNHVALFKKLLSTHNCEGWDRLDDSYFLQGAIQLALGKNSDQFIPEIIGFNLGYEQLPLHLLITAYELVELGIDPYYFTLHITIDNLDSGHAKQAVEAITALRPKATSSGDFYRRVVNGYQLNALGMSTCAIIESFNLNQEVLKILQNKAVIGQLMHSDRCKISGRPINEWLSSADGVVEFLEQMQLSGWIKRHQDPNNSKFWRLIQGDQPLMFGVFSAYEQQLIFDWIAGDYRGRTRSAASGERREIALTPNAPSGPANTPIASLTERRGKIIHGYIKSTQKPGGDELNHFDETLAALSDPQATMQYLINAMSPAKHSTSLGLHSTKIFKKMYDGFNNFP
jgi:hypothetical protein